MVERLKKNVWYMNRCCGCGACISTCSKNILSFPEEDHPIQEIIERRIGFSHITIDTCFFCEKTCEESCPRLKDWERGVPMLHTATVASRLPAVSIINALLIASIRRKLIDGVILWDVEKENFKPIPKIALTEEEIQNTSGYQHLWYPILEALNDAIYKKKLKKIAIVGPPCVAQAVKCIRNSSNDRLKIYRNSLYMMIGFFCEGMYTHQLVQVITDRFNVNPYELNELTVDLNNRVLRVSLQDGLVKGISLSEIRRYMKKGCACCTDFLGESADISIGRTSLDEERALAIVWTPVGEKCLNYALMEKTIRLSEILISLDDIQRFIIDKQRRERVQEINSLILSMLENMSYGKRREEVMEKMKLIWR
ncbi:MAG: Coenzyme F420 hydrogenase/dehydrogenase, beta subunit C-terminal domain [Nitrososphaeria archaeon]|nr:Coenzyme F420 hydrogenase/dehydrogenase, beta subunit C-terminal domain [Nitrososphaeria archaeon]MDW7986563.1 Coenzyme F420 hydrogenase/dehydrogenase, beta subunit C-terminal domain [Nitrososphaerota archaeon]